MALSVNSKMDNFQNGPIIKKYFQEETHYYKILKSNNEKGQQ